MHSILKLKKDILSLSLSIPFMDVGLLSISLSFPSFSSHTIRNISIVKETKENPLLLTENKIETEELKIKTEVMKQENEEEQTHFQLKYDPTLRLSSSPLSTATELELDNIGGGADQLYFIQLPSQLPLTIKRSESLSSKTTPLSQKNTKETKQTKETVHATSPLLNEVSNSLGGVAGTTLADISEEFKSVLPHIPAGQLGSIRIHRSGRVTFKIGDILFDVCPPSLSLLF